MRRFACTSSVCVLSAVLGATGSGAAAWPPFRMPPGPAAQPAAKTPTKIDSDLYKAESGPFTVRTFDEDWVDAARTRTIPVRVYLPVVKVEEKAGKYPVIVFSPGLGGSRINYGYFARHLASHGYLVVVLSHPGSDTAAAVEWVRSHGGAKTGQRLAPNADDDSPGGWLMTSINDPGNLRERPRDISFVLDHLPGHKTLGPIADMKHVGVGGHSFGAYTAMAIGGMRVDLPETHGGKGQSFRDPRVAAVLPMSPEGTGVMGIVSGAWEKFEVPVLFLTGTRDYGAGGRSASWRRQAFEAIHGVDEYLITLSEAGHLTFGNPNGRGGRGAPEKGLRPEALIDSLGVAFFDAYVREEAGAKDWLGKFTMAKRGDCVQEFRPKGMPR